MGYVSNGDEYALVAALESEAMSAQINLTSTRVEPSGGKKRRASSRPSGKKKKMSLDPQHGEQFLRYFCVTAPMAFEITKGVTGP